VPRAAQTTLVDGSQDEVTAQDEDGDAHPKDRDHECRHGLLLFELSCRPDNAKDMFAFPMRCFILLLRNRLCALALVVPTLVRSNQRRSPLHLAIQHGAGEPERPAASRHGCNYTADCHGPARCGEEPEYGFRYIAEI
jgi:hypothetical protein